ncbi:unnamed protein product [Lactuca virosa]|uniref:Uncharacterized protein n=1 Tax=Lactuca virosa TaxID=75947 RepID=A0AAU9MTJ1_9ASTR|nr:unnamed protein product [Lactuca virosa]
MEQVVNKKKETIIMPLFLELIMAAGEKACVSIEGGCKLSNNSSTWTSIRRVKCSLSSMSFKGTDGFSPCPEKKVFAVFIIRFEIAQRLLTAKLVTDLQPTAYRALPSFKAASTLLLREKFTVAISLLPSPPITGDTGYSLAFSGLLTERI